MKNSVAIAFLSNN